MNTYQHTQPHTTEAHVQTPLHSDTSARAHTQTQHTQPHAASTLQETAEFSV